MTVHMTVHIRKVYVHLPIICSVNAFISGYRASTVWKPTTVALRYWDRCRGQFSSHLITRGDGEQLIPWRSITHDKDFHNRRSTVVGFQIVLSPRPIIED